jgi:hypothetical protein
MKKLIFLILLLNTALIAGAQTIKQDTAYKARFYDPRIIRYMPAAPKAQQSNPYAFADSAKAKKATEKSKKKTR